MKTDSNHLREGKAISDKDLPEQDLHKPQKTTGVPEPLQSARQIAETVRYCRRAVYESDTYFFHRTLKNLFDLHKSKLATGSFDTDNKINPCRKSQSATKNLTQSPAEKVSFNSISALAGNHQPVTKPVQTGFSEVEAKS